MSAGRPHILGACVVMLAIAACASPDSDTMEMEEASMEDVVPGSRIAQLLKDGEVVFGAFARPQNAEGGVVAGENRETDFIFYSLETGPWNIPTMESFIASMTEASGALDPHPVILRIPPIRDDPSVVPERVLEGLAAGVEGLVFPHVETAAEISMAISAIGDRSWPSNPEGDVITVVLIEDQAGVEAAYDIVGQPGVTVAIPGPGDLLRAYDGDMEAVEGAIQAVLAACLELDVPCGITAGVDDIVERIEQGFRFFIVTQAEAITVGRAAAGRGD